MGWRRKNATKGKRLYLSTVFVLVLTSVRLLLEEVTETEERVIERVRRDFRGWKPKEKSPDSIAYMRTIHVSNLTASAITIRINVIANNRLSSLRRLLSSLQAAHYDGDIVPLHVFLEANQGPELLHYVSNLEWKNGPLEVHARQSKGGLINAVVESWYPTSASEFATFLEDDIEVSPFFYLWLKRCLRTFSMDGKVHSKWAGISLFTPRIMEYHPNKLQHNYSKFDSIEGVLHTSPFLHQQPCSWGALYFPHIWQEYRLYLAYRLKGRKSHSHFRIPESRSNGWRGSWKKYMMELFWLKGYFLLYPNLPYQRSFSTNHLEAGEHIPRRSHKHHPQHYTVPLVWDASDLDVAIPRKSAFSLGDLPVLDMFGKIGFTFQSLGHLLHSRNADVKRLDKITCKEKMLQQCKEYAVDVVDFLTTEEKYSIVILNVPPVEAVEILTQLLWDSSELELLDKIIVVGSNRSTSYTTFSLFGSVGIYFVPTICLSRYQPYPLDMRITTDAVLFLDGVVSISRQGTDCMFRSWLSKRNHLAKVESMGHLSHENEKTVYYEESTVGSEDTKRHILEGEAIMVSRSFLYQYQCGPAHQLEVTFGIGNVLLDHRSSLMI